MKKIFVAEIDMGSPDFKHQHIILSNYPSLGGKNLKMVSAILKWLGS